MRPAALTRLAAPPVALRSMPWRWLTRWPREMDCPPRTLLAFLLQAPGNHWNEKTRCFFRAKSHPELPGIASIFGNQQRIIFFLGGISGCQSRKVVEFGLMFCPPTGANGWTGQGSPPSKPSSPVRDGTSLELNWGSWAVDKSSWFWEVLLLLEPLPLSFLQIGSSQFGLAEWEIL